MENVSWAMPKAAMVLAAGLGTRMRDYDDAVPKPLVCVGGRTLIDRVLDMLVRDGVSRVVVNVSYLGEQIVAHLQQRDDVEIVLSREEEPLETGGGVLKALSLLGDAPFFVINSDALWVDEEPTALQRLAEAYWAEAMDALLLVSTLDRATGYGGVGDFACAEDGRIRRLTSDSPALLPVVYTGVQILHPRVFRTGLFGGRKVGEKFSLAELFKEKDAEGWIPGVRALVHEGSWMHVGDGDGVRAAEKVLKGGEL